MYQCGADGRPGLRDDVLTGHGHHRGLLRQEGRHTELINS